MIGQHKHRPEKKNQQGVALILALLFVVVMTVIVVEFSYEAQVDASFAFNQGNDLEAYIAAKSAVALGMAQLAEHLVMLLEAPTTAAGTQSMPMFSGEQYDSKEDPWAIGRPFEPINNATMRTTISDEYGKINLNALLDSSSGQAQERTFLVEALRFFFWTRLDSNGEDPVDAILDWLDYDDDDNERPNGAEQDYYMGLERPYMPKNGPMDSLEELLLIQGITPEVYFGDPQADPPILPLSEYLTVHGDWGGAVNVNTARPEVIEAISYGWSQTGQVAIDHDGILAELDFSGRITSRQRLNQYVQVNMQNQQQRRNRRNRQPNQPTPPPEAGDRQFFAAKQAQDDGGNPNDPNDPNNPANPNNPNNPNNPGATGQLRAFTISSNCFRIHGDGLVDDVMVRIEAFVWRLPLDLNSLQASIPPGGQGLFQPPAENFRILSWKVIR